MNKHSHSYWHLHLTVPASMVQPFSALLEELADSVSTFEPPDGNDHVVEALFQKQPDTSALKTKITLLATALGLSDPVVKIVEKPHVDWLVQNYASFKPIQAGRYFIHGSHFKDHVPAGTIPLMIDAATAFGSGEHETTRGCLMALDKLAGQLPAKPRILDIGCGSGILALAAAKTWNVPVTAVDIDPEAVRVALENAVLNGVGSLIRAEAGDGYATPLVAQKGPYDLIFANILADPIKQMAPDLARHLAPEGFAILSGFLNYQESPVLEAHLACNLLLIGHIEIGNWLTLTMRKPG